MRKAVFVCTVSPVYTMTWIIIINMCYNNCKLKMLLLAVFATTFHAHEGETRYGGETVEPPKAEPQKPCEPTYVIDPSLSKSNEST